MEKSRRGNLGRQVDFKAVAVVHLNQGFHGGYVGSALRGAGDLFWLS